MSSSTNLIVKLKAFFHRSQDQDDHSEILRQSPSWTHAITAGITLAACAGFAWLALAKTEEVVIVTGKLEPRESVKEIEASLPGILSNIYVKEGDKVAENQLLMKLDMKANQSSLVLLEQTLAAKRKGLLLQADELNTSQQQAIQKDKSLRTTLAIQQEVLKRLESLLKSGGIPELQFWSQKDKVQQTTSDIDQNLLGLKKSFAQLQQQRAAILAELYNTEQQIKQVQQSLKYQDIRSPSSGYVFDLKSKYPGIGVQPRDILLKVVPSDMLVAKVEVPSDKIGFVHSGMAAELSIDSFPSTDYGVVHAQVQQVGSDALPPDPTRNRQTYMFPSTLTLQTQRLLLKNGASVKLAAGMSVRATLKLRKVSYLSMLFQSLSDKTDALRAK